MFYYFQINGVVLWFLSHGNVASVVVVRSSTAVQSAATYAGPLASR
jgi:hypothetical protein